MLTYETDLWREGFVRVAGVDEAGRGPLAGPVMAAAVIFDADWVRMEQNSLLQGLTDSKQLTCGRREYFFRILQESPHVEIGVGSAGADEIDAVNILRATHRAMARALEQLRSLPGIALIDGLAVAGLPCPSRAIVGGDARSLSIAAASVVAKVRRDARMAELDVLYPVYGFARHKGYGTREHMQALYEYGPCPEHRRSFAPVREAEGNRGTAPAQPFFNEQWSRA